jgi:hypothetical protein
LREGDRGLCRPSGLISPFEVAWDASYERRRPWRPVLRQHKTGTGWIEKFGRTRRNGHHFASKRTSGGWTLQLPSRSTGGEPRVARRTDRVARGHGNARAQGDIHRRESREMTIGTSAGSPPVAPVWTRVTSSRGALGVALRCHEWCVTPLQVTFGRALDRRAAENLPI